MTSGTGENKTKRNSAQLYVSTPSCTYRTHCCTFDKKGEKDGGRSLEGAHFANHANTGGHGKYNQTLLAKNSEIYRFVCVPYQVGPTRYLIWSPILLARCQHWSLYKSAATAVCIICWYLETNTCVAEGEHYNRLFIFPITLALLYILDIFRRTDRLRWTLRNEIGVEHETKIEKNHVKNDIQIKNYCCRLQFENQGSRLKEDSPKCRQSCRTR